MTFIEKVGTLPFGTKIRKKSNIREYQIVLLQDRPEAFVLDLNTYSVLYLRDIFSYSEDFYSQAEIIK